MRSINLVHDGGESRARSARDGWWRRPLPWPASPALVPAAVGLVGLVAAVLLYVDARRSLDEIRAAIVEARADSSALHDRYARVSALEDAQRRLAARVAVLDEVVDGRGYWLDLLETLSTAMPSDTWLERVDRDEADPERVRIMGATFANAAVTEYMRGLEASPVLERVRLVGVGRAERDSFAVQEFTLLAALENHTPILIQSPAEEES